MMKRRPPAIALTRAALSALALSALLAACPMPDKDVPAQLPAPELDPSAGSYTGPLTVRCVTDYSWYSSHPSSDGVLLRYTTDGSDPFASASAVETPALEIALFAPGVWTVRVFALDSYFFCSQESSATYTIDAP
ncbi:MAG: chitobiase/beta-hexosaminidase C-terminal domain-containing protein [Spirochaetia bacterium]|nr:chitobiase/beta-hexosaminidase C-terminal domain-containing protein [Spirochaetia bacterium]